MNDQTVTISAQAADYIKTIVDAAAKGTVSTEGMQVIGFLMRGWTLAAAKHQVFVVAPKLRQNA